MDLVLGEKQQHTLKRPLQKLVSAAVEELDLNLPPTTIKSYTPSMAIEEMALAVSKDDQSLPRNNVCVLWKDLHSDKV